MAFDMRFTTRLPKLDFRTSSKQIMSQIGAAAVAFIGKRTASGVDVNRGSFKQYSKSYQAFKAKKGRSSNVDLTFTGNMLRSMTVLNATENKATIGFTRPLEAEKASYHNEGTDRLPKRKFFAISKQEKQSIIEQFKDWLKSTNKTLR